MKVISVILAVMFIVGAIGIITYNIVGIVKDIKTKRNNKEKENE